MYLACCMRFSLFIDEILLKESLQIRPFLVFETRKKGALPRAPYNSLPSWNTLKMKFLGFLCSPFISQAYLIGVFDLWRFWQRTNRIQGLNCLSLANDKIGYLSCMKLLVKLLRKYFFCETFQFFG